MCDCKEPIPAKPVTELSKIHEPKYNSVVPINVSDTDLEGGDEKEEKAVAAESKDIMQQSAEYQKSYPPDWEAAERHGMAKGVVKALNT